MEGAGRGKFDASYAGLNLRVSGLWLSRVDPAFLAPVLAALYFAFAVPAGGGSDLIRARDLELPLAVTLGIAGGAWALGYALTRDRRRAAVISLTVVTAFATVGYLHELVSDFRSMPLAREPVLLGAYLIGTLAVILFVARSRRTFAAPLRFCTLLGALLGTFAGTRVAWAIHRSEPERLTLPVSTIRTTGTPAEPPDIYLIVPDKYTGTARLADDYGFDNHPFVEAL